MAKYPESLDGMPPGGAHGDAFIGRHLPSLSITLLVGC